MKNKDIHIVFGKGARGTFIHSKKFDLESIQLICLEDCLNLGPICDLDSVEEMEERKNWMLKVYDDPTFIAETGTLEFINKDIEMIKTLISNYQNEKIFLWTGTRASEIINTSRLLYHLPINSERIFIFDFSNFSKKNIHNEVVYPSCLSAMDLSRVNNIEKHFRQLMGDELSKYRVLWEKVKTRNSMLSILDSNEIIVEKDESYFDSFLLLHCTDEFQPPAFIIGKTLCDIGFNVDDFFLNYRLRQLVLMKKLEYRGELKQMRSYDIRLQR